MRHNLTLLLAGAIAVSPAQAAQNNQTEQDKEAIVAAADAIHAGKPAEAVAEADTIISRFETGRDADAIYVCTNGTSDTLVQLIASAAVKDKQEDARSASTVTAVPSTVCDAYFLKGFAFVDLDKRSEALTNFQIAIAMDPDNTHYLNELGEWYKTERNWEKSLEIFTRASEIADLGLMDMEETEAAAIRDRRRCRSFRGIAFNHVEMRHWKEAREALEKCLAIDPADIKSRQEMDFIEEQTAKAG
ncbi:MAG: hypothetical protein GW859_05240 [Sphingomonadales bacterium]|nr:hypothetical protein [Sphingomonadales bacterium]